EISSMTKRLVFVSILLFILSGTAQAHDPGLSAVDVRILDDRIVAEVSFAPADWKRIRQLESNLLIIEDDRHKLELQSVRLKPSDQGSVHFLLEFANPNAGALRITA